MVEVAIEEIISRLDREMEKALEDAVSYVLPDAIINKNQLFKAFVKAVGKRCSNWESVPDHCVKK